MRASVFPVPCTASTTSSVRVTRYTPERFGSISRAVSFPNSACPLFDDALEAAVMIRSVVKLTAVARHDAPCTTIARTRGPDRVLAVVAAAALRQELLPVLERPAVLGVGKRAAGPDQRQGFARFLRQLGGGNVLRQRRGQHRHRHPAHGCGGFLRRRCSSRSCFSVAGLGAPVSRSWPRCVLGKAITSRIASAPAIRATMRSKPKAMPPCGGAPYCSASSRKPNFARCSSLLIFMASNTLVRSEEHTSELQSQSK